MADLTFKAAYDADQARQTPIGDTLDSTENDDFMGLSAPDPDNGNVLTDIGITLAQLRRAIDHPAYIKSGFIGTTSSVGTDAPTKMGASINVPAGFTTDSSFQIEFTAKKITAASAGTLGLRINQTADPSNASSFVIWVPFASDDIVLTRRTNITVAAIAGGITAIFAPQQAIPDPYGLSTVNLSSVTMTVEIDTVPWSMDFVCASDAGDGTQFAINSWTIFGINASQQV